MASYGIGGILRAERVRQSLTIEEVARKTKISPRFLKAIEEEDFDSLPGLVFARGFIRQYANLLNLDTESILASLPKAEAVALPVPEAAQRDHTFSAASRWDPRWNSAAGSLLWIGLSIAATGGAYWYFNRHSAPAAVAETPRAAAQTPPSPSVTAPAAQPGSAQPGSTSAVPGAAITPASLPAKPVQVTLTASEPAWVSITADGKNAFTGILQPDEKKQVDADSAVRLVAGNAGGLKISLNGKDLEPLGPRGQVRSIRLTADGPQPVLRTPVRYDPL